MISSSSSTARHWSSGIGGCRSAGRRLRLPRERRRRQPAEARQPADRTSNVGASLADRYVFYFGSRPVASMELAGGWATFLYLSVDHLGTPVLATDGLADLIWEGGFEPFGRDWQTGTPNGAQGGGVFLRFPGQWFDETWEGTAFAATVYNTYRWYQSATARYTRPDPLGWESGDPNVYLYAAGSPIVFSDSLGLAIKVDPSLEPFVKCARQAPFFERAWQWFLDNGEWTMHPIDSFPGQPLLFGQTFPLDRDYGTPDCKKGGRIFPDDRTGTLPRGGPESCALVTTAIAHEIVETWASCHLGMSNRDAHEFVQRGPKDHSNGLDDDISEIGCSSCACKAGLPP